MSKNRGSDFKLEEVLAAIKLLKDSESTVLAMEGLLTTCVMDESQWSIAWTKMFRHVLETKKVPAALGDIGMDIPQKFQYMLNAQMRSENPEPVKVEGDEDERGDHEAKGSSSKKTAPSSGK